MAKKKKLPQEVNVEELKEQLWNAVLHGSVSDLPDDLESKISKISSGITVEIPALTMSIRDIGELINEFEGYGYYSGIKTLFDHLKKVGPRSDEQMMEYHEKEMLRHAEAVEVLKKKLST